MLPLFWFSEFISLINIVYHICRTYSLNHIHQMKNTILLKRLVDIIYFLHFIGLIGIVIVLFLGNFTMDQIEHNDSSILFWILAALGLVIYVVVLISLHYLRKVSKNLLIDRKFSTAIITNLRKSSIHFLADGGLLIFLMLTLWVGNFFNGKIEFVYDLKLITSLFLMIIGLFFIIQSNTLSLAKDMKEENELTI